MKASYQETDRKIPYEISIDECGRGPMFGRVYAAAVILPTDPADFDFSKMCDSKRIHSKKKMRKLAEYIQDHALDYSIKYVEADEIDRVNILQADMNAMHECIRELFNRVPAKESMIVVDGNYFRPYSLFDQGADNGNGTIFTIPHVTIEQGDSHYAGIAAASILAKDARDTYIAELCEEYPELKTRYSLDRNMGYGTKAHLDGIRQHGITQWHRRTFGLCKTAPMVPL
jgi:ribonuclease HII